jgi:hypothetical protein
LLIIRIQKDWLKSIWLRENSHAEVFIIHCMTVFLSLFQTMKSHLHHAVLVAGIFSAIQVLAGTYPLGDMTCPEIGQFASKAMQWREDGVTAKEAVQRLDNLRPGESVEKKNLLMVLSLVYGGYGDGWTVKSAGDAMRIDCQAGR